MRKYKSDRPLKPTSITGIYKDASGNLRTEDICYSNGDVHFLILPNGPYKTIGSFDGIIMDGIASQHGVEAVYEESGGNKWFAFISTNSTEQDFMNIKEALTIWNRRRKIISEDFQKPEK